MNDELMINSHESIMWRNSQKTLHVVCGIHENVLIVIN
jgi:hypothetical protein